MRGFNGTVSMNEWLKRVRWRDAAAPIFAVLCVMALLFRLPNFAMDFLLSLNLALSVSIFLSVFFARTPLEFSSFPTILLLSTLFRLVLNVSTTRLILIQGDAGQVISAFSRFVAGGNIVVGCVIFLIFIVIQFVVITKGATRISEVSARFTLDALPGRQSAIDFDLNAGNISEKEAKAARAELAEQADFFGAMDGASKFVRGDAIAGLVIVAVNLIGGFVIGTLQQGRSPAEAVELYSKLTIGDGLVSQILSNSRLFNLSCHRFARRSFVAKAEYFRDGSSADVWEAGRSFFFRRVSPALNANGASRFTVDNPCVRVFHSSFCGKEPRRRIKRVATRGRRRRTNYERTKERRRRRRLYENRSY